MENIDSLIRPVVNALQDVANAIQNAESAEEARKIHSSLATAVNHSDIADQVWDHWVDWDEAKWAEEVRTKEERC